jgi:hypothetical protein
MCKSPANKTPILTHVAATRTSTLLAEKKTCSSDLLYWYKGLQWMNIARMPRILLYPTQIFENAGDIVLKTRLPRQYLSLPLRASFPCSFLDIGFVLTIFKMHFKVGD